MLTVSSVIFKILAWLGVILGIISCIAILIKGGTPQVPRWMGFVSLVVWLIYFFIFMSASEIIKLLLEIRSRLK
jgi:hypothetical protein